MSVNTEVKLTREEVRVLHDYWNATYECLSDEDYEKYGLLVDERISKYEFILSDLIDNDSDVKQLKRI